MSHGFRPGRDCNTALEEIASKWAGTTWFIEGDIADCFGSLDHEVMLAILAENIHDRRFLDLVGDMLTAGYWEDFTWHATYSGAPQGGVLSPILSNIYLDRLDRFVADELVPAFTRGMRRRPNREYANTTRKIGYWRQRGDRDKVTSLRRVQQSIPVLDVTDPDYRRLRYIRYADDHLLGFVGPKAEAEQLKDQLAGFLKDTLRLDLSPEKTLITHARTLRPTHRATADQPKHTLAGALAEALVPGRFRWGLRRGEHGQDAVGAALGVGQQLAGFRPCGLVSGRNHLDYHHWVGWHKRGSLSRDVVIQCCLTAKRSVAYTSGG